ncbi:MCE family protein [Puteibacter caeruleilacunae]|nr:MCE family protein [Puteibacter caeruleilacunae]
MNTKRLSKTGLLIVVSIFALYWGVNYLKGNDVFKSVDTYHVRYQKVDGLVESSAVILNGYKIGQVNEVKFADDASGDLLVTFNLPEGFKVPKNTLAKIISTDLMGTKSISLILTNEKEFHKSGDTLKSDIEGDLKEQVSMQIAPLKNKAEDLLSSLDSAITVVTYVFNESTRDNLKESFEHINNTIYNLEKTSQDLSEMIKINKLAITSIVANMDSITTTISTNRGDIKEITNNLAAFTDTLANMELAGLVKKTNNTMANIDSIVYSIQNQEGSLGLFLKDPALYANLTDASKDLDRLLRDFRANPERYVHFSAIDLGKDIYISPSENGGNSKITYKVFLLSSDIKLEVSSALFDGYEVEEQKVVDSFNYFTGSTNNYQQALETYETVRSDFPNAEIIAFKNGRKIKLQKAVRKSK